MSLFDTITKPTLLINEQAARQNIQRMAEKARACHVAFRPHFKTHQSAEIGAWFRAEGVAKITVSSVEMAQYFAARGWNDITIAFPANIRQAEEMAQLARRVKLGLLMENIEATELLAQAIVSPVDIWLKIDVGARRTGIPFDAPAQAEQVARAVKGAAQFTLKGLLTHAGHTYGATGKTEVCRLYAESAARIDGLRKTLVARGLEPLQVSVGDTPGCSLCDDLGPVDEIRPGNFIYYDTLQMQIGSCRWDEIAVALACPVVALHPERNEATIFGGAIHLSKDRDRVGYGAVALPEGEGWGAPLEGASVARLSQEHGILSLKPEDLARLHVGDLVCVLPAHSCLTVTCMRRYRSLDGHWIDTLNA